jgi:hypothetical protein
MATRPKPASPTDSDLLRSILAELQSLNRAVREIARRAGQQAEGDMDPGRPVDPGDSVPPGVAVQDATPLTADDKKVRRALERLPRRGRGEGKR